MMQRREATAIGLAMLGALGATLRVVHTGVAPEERRPQSFAMSGRAVAVDDDSLGEAAANATANDPFRLANRPSDVRYDARTESGIGAPAQLVAPPVRPTFLLKAIVGGPPWSAVVDGIPGQQPGTIVRSGISFDKLTVRSVGRDTVVIQGPDTTWKLTLSRGRP